MLSLCVVCVTQNAFTKGTSSTDECTTAAIAFEGNKNFFDTSNATASQPQPEEGMCTGTFLNWNNSPDIWFVFLPSVSGSYNFTTCNSDGRDTSMVLYKGSCSNLLQIACNGDAEIDGACQDYYSELDFTLTANTIYYVRIGGYGGAEVNLGWGQLTITRNSGGGGNIWYVDHDAAGGNGTSWSDAFQSIDGALNAATAGDQIWVAEGVYTPSVTTIPNDSRSASFVIKDPIGFYGGFDGTEVSLSDRDLFLHNTILSGDLYGNDDPGNNISENAYHVLTAKDITSGSLIIDGFSIHSGNANVATEQFGGGVYVKGSVSVPVNIQFCRIQDNDAIRGGGISFVSQAAVLSLYKSKIVDNSASDYGGGMYQVGAASIDTCMIAGNTSPQGEGGGIICNDDLSILNTTIVQNSAQLGGGIVVYGPTIDVQNSILWGNRSVYGSTAQVQRTQTNMSAKYSCIEDLPDDLIGNNNTDENPHFVSETGTDGQEGTGDENFRLFQGSPCIDAGDNSMVTTMLDLDGLSRFIDDPYTVDTGNNPEGQPISDMGPYEFTPADPNEDGVRIWSGATSSLYQEPDNWLPFDVPGELDTAYFGITGTLDVTTEGSIMVDSVNVSQGTVKFNLGGSYILFRNTLDSMQIGRFGVPASLRFLNGYVISNGEINISGAKNELKIAANATLQTDRVSIVDRGIFNLANDVYGEVVNSGGIIDLAGTSIRGSSIIGNLNILQQGSEPLQPSEIIFDIAGTSAGVNHDALSVSQSADLTGMTLTLRFDEDWAPTVGDMFHLINAEVSVLGLPNVLAYSGLPSNFGCAWNYGLAARGTGGAVVTTTGPILFDSVSSKTISATPNAIVVADFDGVNGSDVAVSMPATTGTASVEIFLNNGMSGGSWQGFADPISVTTGSSAEYLIVGEIDNDVNSSPDLVVTNYDDDSVTILLNDGSGNFTTTTLSTGVGSGPISLALGDFDETDGDLLDDLAVGCDGSSVGVKIYTNSTVAAASGPRVPDFNLTSTWLTPVPTTIDPIDVNDDKDLDIIVLSGPSNSVTVKKGDGEGGTVGALSTPIGLPTGSLAVAGSVALLNTDSDKEYITLNNGGSSLSILSGTGNSVGSPAPFDVGDEPLSIETTDFDNDGDTDMVVSELDSFGTRQLAILRNDSSGSLITLGTLDPVGNGSDPTLVATGDFDADTLQDIVSIIDLAPAMSANSPAIGVYLNATALACPEDTNGDDVVDVADLLAIIAAWGSNNASADLDGNGIVDVADLLMIISAWGPC